MKTLLIDTDVVIDYLRQPRKKTLLKTLLKGKTNKISITAITLTELWRGKSIQKLKEKAKVNSLLGKIGVIVADEEISKEAGKLLRIYQHLMLADSLVAATAINRLYTLVTFNKKHFTKIKNLILY